MEAFETEELLWDPETGGENIVLPQEESFDDSIAEFEIPDIPTTFPVPEESTPLKTEEPEPVWDLRAAKQKLKETKKLYRLEKKRQRRGAALWLTGVLCTLLGGILGAVLTWLFLTK